MPLFNLKVLVYQEDQEVEEPKVVELLELELQVKVILEELEDLLQVAVEEQVEQDQERHHQVDLEALVQILIHTFQHHFNPL